MNMDKIESVDVDQSILGRLTTPKLSQLPCLWKATRFPVMAQSG